MQNGQLTFDDILSLFRRRKKYIILPVLVLTIICTIGAFLIPRKYEASSTLLVQRDEVSNPLLRFGIEATLPTAVATPAEDKFRTFNEIIYSRQTLETLLDTLGLAKGVSTETRKQALLKEIRQKIETEKRSPETFTISFVDHDPIKTQLGASTLANLFIQSNQRIDNERNELAVNFFEKKLEDFRIKYETTQKARIQELKQRVGEVPPENRVIYDKMEDVDRRITDIDLRIKSLRQTLATLKEFPGAFDSDAGRQSLFDIEHAEVPFAGELHSLASKYDDFTRRYTPRYPEIKLVREQILDLLEKIRGAVETEIAKLQSQRFDFEHMKSGVVEDIKKKSVEQNAEQDKETNYDIFRQLYDDMKVKLEQARTARDLGRKGGSQFVIIDPAVIPTEPTKPSRSMIIGGGFGAGLLLGLLAAIMAELLDATVRSTRDVEVYSKPIIAFLPAGYPELKN